MLTLTRRRNESIHIGADVVVYFNRFRPGQVRVTIKAPPGVAIVRGELLRTPPAKGNKAG